MKKISLLDDSLNNSIEVSAQKHKPGKIKDILQLLITLSALYTINHFILDAWRSFMGH